MKKLVSIIALLTMLCSTAAFADDTVTVATIDKPLTFTLQQAIDYALINSPQIAISDAAIKSASVNFDEKEFTYNQQKDKTQGAFDGLLTKKGYKAQLAKSGVTLAQKGKEQTIEALKYSVESNYFTLINAKDKLDIEDSMTKLARDNLDNIKTKFNLGVASNLDVLSFETTYTSSVYYRDRAERAFTLSKELFCKALGLPLNTEVTLTDTLSVAAPKDVNNDDLDELVKKAQSERLEVIKANEILVNDKLFFDVTSLWYPSNTFAYMEAENTITLDQNTLNSTLIDMELSVLRTYLDMTGAYEAMQVSDQTINQLEQIYNITKKKYDIGISTNTDVITAFNSLKSAKLDKASAIYNFNDARLQFELSYGIGTGIASLNILKY